MTKAKSFKQLLKEEGRSWGRVARQELRKAVKRPERKGEKSFFSLFMNEVTRRPKKWWD